MLSIPEVMKVNLLTAPLEMEMREQPVPAIPAGGMLIKVASTGICGSDVIKIRNTRSAEPRVIGHEVAGEVAAIAPGAALPFDIGDRVVVGHVHVPCGHCMYCQHGNPSMCLTFKETHIEPGGYAEYIAVTPDHAAHTILPIPDHVSFDEATFVDPVGCVLHAIDLSAIRPNDRVAVIGVGLMGLLFTTVLSKLSVETFAFDISDARLNQAVKYGADHTFNTAGGDPHNEVMRLTENEGVDVVILTFVMQETINRTFDIIRDGGRICTFAGPVSAEPMSMDFYNFFRRELSMVSSYSATMMDMGAAMRWIASGKVPVADFITGSCDLEGILPAVKAMDEHSYKVMVHPDPTR
ncbi:MAG: alcohol dehydrogenase catalytic domain-containing protein [Anaerolineales bacterium]|nr:alcohol dehydrogenase catalytic domain-containing protein [Anaerolineales bacterium]